MKKNIFTLPAPLHHYRAIVGSAQVVADAWQRFGVAVTLETRRLMYLQSFSQPLDAQQFADELNGYAVDR